MIGSVGRMLSYMRRNAIALLALFFALSAGAYAATQAPKNSVVSSSIENGQVRTEDLAKHAGAGHVFKVKANTATTHDNDPCVKKKAGVFCGYTDGGSSDGNFANVGHGLAAVTYSMDRQGIVRLSGTPGVTSYQSPFDVFILPKAMRPAKEHVYTVPCGQIALDATCTVGVLRNGTVTKEAGTTSFAGLGLDSISFRAGG
jgi:hypothetical protein